MINNLSACRPRDTVLEAVGPPNKIVKGEFAVIIGDKWITKELLIIIPGKVNK
jgi:hypothetical protein